MLRTRVKGGVGALIYASDSEESQTKSDFYSLPFCPPAVDSSQTIFREYRSRPTSDNGHCEVSAEVSHSEEDSAEYNLFADAEACFQPIPYNLQNRAPSPIASLWESTGDFSIPDRIPEQESEDFFIVRSSESYTPEHTMSSSTQEPRHHQYAIMDPSSFEPLIASSSNNTPASNWFEPPPMNGSRPVVDFAGRTFQCMDDDHIRAYEHALKKRYVA